MPIVIRSEPSLERFIPLVDYMVNPVNTEGAMGKGIAKALKDMFPDMHRDYLALAKQGQTKIGKLHVWDNPDKTQASIINLPTKAFWGDPSKIEYIRHGLSSLRDFLTGDGGSRALHTVWMPLLGNGEGGLKFAEVYPLFKDYLDDLDNVVHVCINPARFKEPPKYLAIIGPRKMSSEEGKQWQIESNRKFVEDMVKRALDEWGLTWDDFAGVVSGAATDGVDVIACGRDRNDVSYEQSLAKQYHAKPPILCKADWDRYGTNLAGPMRNRTVIDIATHIVAPIPVGCRTTGTPGALRIAQAWNKKFPERKKEVRVYGDELYMKFNT